MNDKCQCQVKAHHAEKGCLSEAIGTLISDRIAEAMKRRPDLVEAWGIEDDSVRLCLECSRHFTEHVSKPGDTVAVIYPNGAPSW